jgi:multidrug efflux system outer membrane protein
MKALACCLLAIIAMLFAGCAVGPDYHKPEATAIPAAYTGADADWKPAEPRAHLPRGNWWEMFGDAELNRLEAEAASANQDLKAAVASFEQAARVRGRGARGIFSTRDAVRGRLAAA